MKHSNFIHSWKKIAATTETYEKFVMHFAWHDMASTLTICFLHHCKPLHRELLGAKTHTDTMKEQDPQAR